jgi:PAS domain S-box-containing protein
MKTIPKPTYKELEKENLKLKQTVDRLRGDQEKYRAIYDHQFNCIYIHDLEGNFLDANDAALSMLGYEKDEILDLNFSAIIENEHLPQAAEFLDGINQTSYEPRIAEYKLKRKDGSFIWVDAGGALICKEGKLSAFLGVARDITERKQTEEALKKVRDELDDRIKARTAQLTAANRRLEREIEERKQIEAALQESESNYRQLVQSANSIILRLGPRGNIKFMNEFARTFFGYREEDILGRNVVGTIVPHKESSGRDLAAMIKDIGTHPERYLNNENENMRHNGERVWIAWTNRGIQDEKGHISEILCVGNDTTKRRKAEQALRESEAKFRALAESAPAVTLIVAGGNILYVNQAFEQITGYTREEALAMQFWDVVHPDMQELVKNRGLARQRGDTVPSRYELKALTKGGQTRWMDMAATIINYGGKIATLAVAYDITERKQAEEALLAREQDLENKTQDLEELNAALKVLLKKREDDRVVLEKTMLSNVEQLIEPYLQNLKQTNLSDRQANLLGIIETNVAEILSPFALHFSTLKYKLTPKEIQIANLIKQGKTSKEIADIMGLSARTIEFHRTKIRNKFGLKSGKDNLQANLIALNVR